MQPDSKKLLELICSHLSAPPPAFEVQDLVCDRLTEAQPRFVCSLHLGTLQLASGSSIDDNWFQGEGSTPEAAKLQAADVAMECLGQEPELQTLLQQLTAAHQPEQQGADAKASAPGSLWDTIQRLLGKAQLQDLALDTELQVYLADAQQHADGWLPAGVLSQAKLVQQWAREHLPPRDTHSRCLLAMAIKAALISERNQLSPEQVANSCFIVRPDGMAVRRKVEVPGFSARCLPLVDPPQQCTTDMPAGGDTAGAASAGAGAAQPEPQHHLPSHLPLSPAEASAISRLAAAGKSEVAEEKLQAFQTRHTQQLGQLTGGSSPAASVPAQAGAPPLNRSDSLMTHAAPVVKPMAHTPQHVTAVLVPADLSAPVQEVSIPVGTSLLMAVADVLAAHTTPDPQQQQPATEVGSHKVSAAYDQLLIWGRVGARSHRIMPPPADVFTDQPAPEDNNNNSAPATITAVDTDNTQASSMISVTGSDGDEGQEQPRALKRQKLNTMTSSVGVVEPSQEVGQLSLEALQPGTHGAPTAPATQQVRQHVQHAGSKAIPAPPAFSDAPGVGSPSSSQVGLQLGSERASERVVSVGVGGVAGVPAALRVDSTLTVYAHQGPTAMDWAPGNSEVRGPPARVVTSSKAGASDVAAAGQLPAVALPESVGRRTLQQQTHQTQHGKQHGHHVAEAPQPTLYSLLPYEGDVSQQQLNARASWLAGAAVRGTALLAVCRPSQDLVNDAPGVRWHTFTVPDWWRCAAELLPAKAYARARHTPMVTNLPTQYTSHGCWSGPLPSQLLQRHCERLGPWVTALHEQQQQLQSKGEAQHVAAAPLHSTTNENVQGDVAGAMGTAADLTTVQQPVLLAEAAANTGSAATGAQPGVQGYLGPDTPMTGAEPVDSTADTPAAGVEGFDAAGRATPCMQALWDATVERDALARLGFPESVQPEDLQVDPAVLVQAAEEQEAVAEQQEAEAVEQVAAMAVEQAAEAMEQAAEAMEQAAEAMEQAAEAEQQAAEAEQQVAEAEQQVAEAEQQVAEAEQQVAEAEQQVAVAGRLGEMLDELVADEEAMMVETDAAVEQLQVTAEQLEAQALQLEDDAGQLEAMAEEMGADGEVLEAQAEQMEAQAELLEAMAGELLAMAGHMEAAAGLEPTAAGAMAVLPTPATLPIPLSATLPATDVNMLDAASVLAADAVAVTSAAVAAGGDAGVIDAAVAVLAADLLAVVPPVIEQQPQEEVTCVETDTAVAAALVMAGAAVGELLESTGLAPPQPATPLLPLLTTPSMMAGTDPARLLGTPQDPATATPTDPASLDPPHDKAPAGPDEAAATQHEVSATQHQVSATQHQASATQHEVSATQHQVSATQHDVSATQHDVSDEEAPPPELGTLPHWSARLADVESPQLLEVKASAYAADGCLCDGCAVVHVDDLAVGEQRAALACLHELQRKAIATLLPAHHRPAALAACAAELQRELPGARLVYDQGDDRPAVLQPPGAVLLKEPLTACSTFDEPAAVSQQQDASVVKVAYQLFIPSQLLTKSGVFEQAPDASVYMLEQQAAHLTVGCGMLLPVMEHLVKVLESGQQATAGPVYVALEGCDPLDLHPRVAANLCVHKHGCEVGVPGKRAPPSLLATPPATRNNQEHVSHYVSSIGRPGAPGAAAVQLSRSLHDLFGAQRLDQIRASAALSSLRELLVPPVTSSTTLTCVDIAPPTACQGSSFLRLLLSTYLPALVEVGPAIEHLAGVCWNEATALQLLPDIQTQLSQGADAAAQPAQQPPAPAAATEQQQGTVQVDARQQPMDTDPPSPGEGGAVGTTVQQAVHKVAHVAREVSSGMLQAVQDLTSATGLVRPRASAQPQETEKQLETAVGGPAAGDGTAARTGQQQDKQQASKQQATGGFVVLPEGMLSTGSAAHVQPSPAPPLPLPVLTNMSVSLWCGDPLAGGASEAGVGRWPAELRGCDCVTMLEVVQRLAPDQLQGCGAAILGSVKPGVWVVSSPCADYNPVLLAAMALKWQAARDSELRVGQVAIPAVDDQPTPVALTYEDLKTVEQLWPGRSVLRGGTLTRHQANRFEWTRSQFRSWATDTAAAFGYDVMFKEVGHVVNESEALAALLRLPSPSTPHECTLAQQLLPPGTTPPDMLIEYGAAVEMAVFSRLRDESGTVAGRQVVDNHAQQPVSGLQCILPATSVELPRVELPALPGPDAAVAHGGPGGGGDAFLPEHVSGGYEEQRGVQEGDEQGQEGGVQLPVPGGLVGAGADAELEVLYQEGLDQMGSHMQAGDELLPATEYL